jgi:aminopeptidase N
MSNNILVVIFLALITQIASLPIEKDEPVVSYRLPNDTYPIRYEIYLRTNIHTGTDFKFDGYVKIQIKVKEATQKITIHSKWLNIESAKIFESLNKEIPGATFELNEKLEFLIVKSPQVLIKDQEYYLEIVYNGTLREDYNGFFRASYVNEANQTIFLASTQFQSTEARHAFPCYDEAGIRAVYSMAFRHHSSYTALANMQVVEVIYDGDYHITKFEDTPEMQAFIVAFTISNHDFISNEKEERDEVLHRVFARPDFIKNGDAQFALDTGIKALTKLELDLKMKYDLPKLDQIGILDKGGAMENWGLVIYDENNLIYNESRSSTVMKERVASVVAHEFAVSYSEVGH